MSLDVHIYGSGYGETILLRWPTDTGAHGAVIDARSSQNGEWLAQKIRELGIERLDFVSATHPHADHIWNFAAGVEASGKDVGQYTFWGGASLSLWRAFFDEVKKQNAGNSGLTRLGKMALKLTKWLRQKQQTNSVMDLAGHAEEQTHTFFEGNPGGTSLKVRSLGPWFGGMASVTRDLVALKKNKPLSFKLSDANAVSTAMLIEYGDAQVILGSDMEHQNWKELMATKGYPKFRPSVVKVRHHGSNTGCIAGMWNAGVGFFHGRGKDSIAIVTPWRLAGNELPSGTAVLDQIRAAGFDMYVTGQKTTRYKNADSHVAIRVEADGSAKVISEKDAKKYRRTA